MEKVRIILLVSLLIMAYKTKAQDLNIGLPIDPPIPRQGLMRAQLTLCASRMFSDKQSYFYLHGNLEGYLSLKVSLAGEAYYSLGNSSENNTFDYNHSAFFGASWHFIKKNNDFFIGLQPGLSFTKLHEDETTPTHMGTNPLFSSIAGYNFFINRIFHFFIQSRLVMGQHNYDQHKDLSELRFSAGLGFNF